MSGVYIILNKNESTKDKIYVKIGASKDIGKRYKQICASHRFNGFLNELEIYKTIECKSYMKLEKTIHQIMKSRQQLNEWYFTEPSFLEGRLAMVDLSRYN